MKKNFTGSYVHGKLSLTKIGPEKNKAAVSIFTMDLDEFLRFSLLVLRTFQFCYLPVKARPPGFKLSQT